MCRSYSNTYAPNYYLQTTERVLCDLREIERKCKPVLDYLRGLKAEQEELEKAAKAKAEKEKQDAEKAAASTASKKGGLRSEWAAWTTKGRENARARQNRQ